MKRLWRCLGMLVLAGCGRPEHRANAPVFNQTEPIVPAPGTGPNAKTPFVPMKPTVDPKSSEAAEALVQEFARLLNERSFDAAYVMLGSNAPARSDFDQQWTRLANLRVRVGKPGPQEGAAGSIYISVPLIITETASREVTSRSATAILRRVNDVPGSSEAQRRWHIERIGWTAG